MISPPSILFVRVPSGPKLTPNAMRLSGHEQAGTGLGSPGRRAQWSARIAGWTYGLRRAPYGNLNSPLRLPRPMRTVVAALPPRASTWMTTMDWGHAWHCSQEWSWGGSSALTRGLSGSLSSPLTCSRHSASFRRCVLAYKPHALSRCIPGGGTWSLQRRKNSVTLRVSSAWHGWPTSSRSR